MKRTSQVRQQWYVPGIQNFKFMYCSMYRVQSSYAANLLTLLIQTDHVQGTGFDVQQL